MKAVGGAFNMNVLPMNMVQPARRAEKPASKPQTKAKKPEKKEKVDPYAPIDNEEHKQLVQEVKHVTQRIVEAAKTAGSKLPPTHPLVIERDRLKSRADAVRAAHLAK